ncbi:hypothetical protein GE09DRAFT_1257173 [Coniochaeta sp. 2T2.1]|nr:hypothetical protein GE09DRAFT_1257173 [Coniochaeta sp. 2T2.1]
MLGLILLLLHVCSAHALCPNKTSGTIRQLAQFPNNTWVENIAIRSNGQLLVTLFTSPDVYQIDPFPKHPVPPKLVAHFPDALGLLGITEIKEDVFAIAKGIFDPSGDLTPGSFLVWKADFRGGREMPTLSRIADVPDTTIINGMTLVKKGGRILLLADSLAGVVWRLNLDTLKYDIVLNDTTTRPNGALAEGGFGVDGVRCRDGFLFFTNTNLGFFRVRIRDDGTVVERVERMAGFSGADDFDFDDRADAATLLEGTTGVMFGRTKYDRSTLYVTTNGGFEEAVPGEPIPGGRVLAIDH